MKHPYRADKKCENRDCTTIIHHPLHNQRWCDDCRVQAQREDRTRRHLLKRMSPEDAERHIDAIRTHRQQTELIPIEGEVWCDAAGYEGFYSVSDHGRVYSEYQGALVIGTRYKNGQGVQLWHPEKPRLCMFVHLLVLRTFKPIASPWALEAVHLNGDLFDNRLINLEWRFKQMGTAKLRPTDIPQIRTLWNDGTDQAEIAARYDVGPSAISDIICGNTWSYIQGEA